MEVMKQRLSEVRKEQLLLARQHHMAGMSPRERGEEKTLAALNWVYRWGWASSSTLELVGGAIRSGLAARLVKLGLLRKTITQSGGAVRGVPAAFLTLTETGQAEVERHRERLIQYERDPSRVRQANLRHDQMAQTATLKALKAGTIKGFLAERETTAMSAQNIKQPDVVWFMPDGSRAAVEIELTPKWGRIFDQFLVSCLKSLTNQGEENARFDSILLVSDSPALVKRYGDAFKIATYQTWKKNDKGKWVTSQRLPMPEWVRERIRCKLVK